MTKKLTAFAMAALLVLGMTGCGSANNVTEDADRYYGTTRSGGAGGGNDANTYGSGALGNGTYGNNGTGNGSNNGTGNNRRQDNMLDDIGNGIGNAMEGAGNAIEDAGDALTGRGNSYQDMLDNGRVRDTDGYLFDGENSHN